MTQKLGSTRFVYNSPQVNYTTECGIGKRKKKVQRFETSRGCPNYCEYCYEPTKLEVFELPEVTEKRVQILDMNFLWQPNVIDRIKSLRKRGTHYELVCGIDYRLLTHEIATELKKSMFIPIRFAWDGGYNDQYKIRDTLKMLLNAGYNKRDISVFMLVNHKISYDECCNKLDLLKVWGVKVADCCFDGGYKNTTVFKWPKHYIKPFRAKCRKHNQLINFQIDPEVSSD